MAGHSKWANIKRRKGKADAVKGKIFSNLTKEVYSAARQGGADPEMNAKLRLAIQKAKAANVPKDNIARALNKASDKDAKDYEEILYEIYGKGGVGIIARVLTDNRNRSITDLHIATSEKGRGSMAAPGSVSFRFDRKGVIVVSASFGKEEEKWMEVALESGSDDYEINEEGGGVITTAPESLMEVKTKLEKLGVPIDDASIEMLPKEQIECSNEHYESNLMLIELIEEVSDVSEVYHNLQIKEE